MRIDGNIIWAGADPDQFPREISGGKGNYLFGLFNFAQEYETVIVPNFFVIHTRAFIDRIIPKEISEGIKLVLPNDVTDGYQDLNQPTAVRSSSPLEDGIQASFAGKYETVLGVCSIKELKSAMLTVYDSTRSDRVYEYAEQIGIPISLDMAIIVQEQVMDPDAWGIININEDEYYVSYEEKGFDGFINLSVSKKQIERGLAERSEESELNISGAIASAAKARDFLRLDKEAEIQVEFLLKQGEKPYFVQIRQLPKIDLDETMVELEVPPGVIYAESQVCNGIPGTWEYPVYVTFSESQFEGILDQTGHAGILNRDVTDIDREKLKAFSSNSNLASNSDFLEFRQVMNNRSYMFRSERFEGFTEIWRRGDKLFGNYILVCDKLDGSREEIRMSDYTPNKVGIVTCVDNNPLSHAMVISKELGIPAVSFVSSVMDMESFYNQVETGDIVVIKSNGKKAVAYIKEKRSKEFS